MQETGRLIWLKTSRFAPLCKAKWILRNTAKVTMEAPKDLTPGPSPDDKEQERRLERGENRISQHFSPLQSDVFPLWRGAGGEVGFG
jgi:hypothetical protein